MGGLNVNIPPIPAKEGTYVFDDDASQIIYIPKGKKPEDGTIVAPYIPPKRKIVDNQLEDMEDYQKRTKKKLNKRRDYNNI